MRRTIRRSTAAAVMVLGLSAGTLTLGSGAALADGDPVGDLTSGVKKQLKPVTDAVVPKAGSAKAPAKRDATIPSQDPGEPSSQDHSGSNDVDDPKAPDHAGSDVVKSSGAGQDAVGVGSTTSTVEDDDSTSSDASALTIGGMEIVGAHADSQGSQHDSFLGVNQVTDPVCEQSDEAFCAQVLYADADATDDGKQSHSDADSGIVSICAGGSEDADGTCEAPVNGGVAQSSSEADRDQVTGRTTAGSSASMANLCLTAPGESPIPDAPALPIELPIPGGDAAGCAIGAALLTSQGQADSGGSHPSASRSSSVGGLTLAGTSYDASQPQAIEIPPGCPTSNPLDPTDASLLCAYLDQGETYLGPGSTAGHAQEALKAELLPGVVSRADLLSVIGARTETLVHNDGGEPVTPSQPGKPRPGAQVKGVAARAPAVVAGEQQQAVGGLPNTGGPAEALLIGGLLAVGGGAMLVSVSRMRRLGFGV